MKIAIITHHDVHNRRALLQLNALSKVLASHGHSTAELSYKENFDFLGKEAMNMNNITMKSVPYYVKHVMKKGIKKNLFNIKKKSVLEQFRNSNRLVDGYYSKEKHLNCVFRGGK